MTTGLTVVVVVTVGRAFHAGLEVGHGHALAVDREAEILRHRQLVGAALVL
jgi:hypothetical protein